MLLSGELSLLAELVLVALLLLLDELLGGGQVLFRGLRVLVARVDFAVLVAVLLLLVLLRGLLASGVLLVFVVLLI